MIYFDHNATAPMLSCAKEAWVEAVDKYIGNPSSPHRVGARADAALSAARQSLAEHLGCDPLDLVWTSGATESNNMAIHHFRQNLDSDVEAWVSAIEHPCILQPAQWYFGKRLRFIPVERSGRIDLNWLAENLRERPPGMVAVMAANNETGVLQPWREALQLCHEAGVPFLCDAAQWLGRLPARGLGQCDFVSSCGHKFGGPKGVGFLKCPSRGRLTPLIQGGKQEESRRAGTENVPGILAFSAALEHREKQLGMNAHEPLASNRSRFEQRLVSLLPGAEVVAQHTERLWNTTSALMPEAGCQQRWVVKLDKMGFAVSTGSACSSGEEKASHVLAAMGYGAQETSRVLRFSAGWETPAEHWEQLLQCLCKIKDGLVAQPD